MLNSVAILWFSLLVLVPFSNPNLIERPVKNKTKLAYSLKTFHIQNAEQNACPAKILLIGGYYDFDINIAPMEIYYPGMPTKNHLVNVSMLFPRSDHISELLNDHTVITCGGDNSNYEGEFNERACEIYDLHTNKVTRGINLSSSRRRAASAVLDGIVYVCGGISKGEKCEHYRSGVWTRIASMNTWREEFQMVALDGLIYAIGGREGTEIKNNVERYEPVNNRWSMVKPMLEARFGHSAAVIDKLLIVCGGLGGTVGTFSSCESYDSISNTWSPFAKMINDHLFFNLVAAGNRLYAIMSIIVGDEVNVVETYDPKQRKWIPTKPTIYKRERGSVVVIPSCNV